MPRKKKEAVDHPAHYNQYQHEVIDITRVFDFCTGNALKYILRHELKNGEEDLEKACWYLRYMIDHPSVPTINWDLALDFHALVTLAKTYGNTLAVDLVKTIALHCPKDTGPLILYHTYRFSLMRVIEELEKEVSHA